MNVPEKYIDLFQAYSRGELSGIEKKRFDARLVDEAEFKEAFDTYRHIESGIREHYRNEQ